MSAKADAKSSAELSEQQIISYIYDIALDPGNLDGFIDRLESAATGNSGGPAELAQVGALSALLESHLSRAEEFLDRSKDVDTGSATERALASFDATPALLVNSALQVVEANQHAKGAFCVNVNDSLDSLPFDEDDVDELFTTLRKVLRERSGKGVLVSLKARSADDGQQPPTLMHIHWLDLDIDDQLEVAGRRGYALLVSTDVSWPLALDQTLNEVFKLTATERDIVRALVEGGSPKSIAKDRNRSLGTVRTQVKSVLAKTRTHSQSELIRVTMSLMEIVKRSPLVGLPGQNVSVEANIPSEHYAQIQSLTLNDGRRLDFLVQGSGDGHALVFTHMGYGLMRWPPAALQLAAKHRLKIITPIRSGFGDSDAVDKSADILKITREDTIALLDYLGIDRCTYVAQGNDLIFGMDVVKHYPERIKNLIGLGPRLPLSSDIQYNGMGKWHRFLLSTARHAPHLLYFSAKAAFTLGQKIGGEQMFRNVHRNSPADLDTISNPEVAETLNDSSQITLSRNKHAAFAYAKELFASETDWSDLVHATQHIPAWYVSGSQDPLGDPSTIAAYRETFPWIDIDVMEDAGQLLFFQKFEELIPRIAESAQTN